MVDPILNPVPPPPTAQRLLVDIDDLEFERQTQNTQARQMTAAEERAELAQQIEQLDARDTGLVDALRDQIVAARESLREALGSRPALRKADVGKFSLNRGRLRRAARRGMRETFAQGRSAALREIRGAQMQDPNVEPTAALEFLRSKADFFVSGLGHDAEEAVRVALLFSIKNGLTTREAMLRVQESLLPWTGDPEAADPKAQRPSRIETVVRTNSTEAYNQGRVVAMRDPDVAEFVQAVQYSAILDTRTTEVCRHLDGRYFRPDDPDLDRLTPPNHFNCRSVLVPVVVGDEPPDEFISAADVGEARDLAGRGFA